MGKKHKKESRKRKHSSRSRSPSYERDEKEKKKHHKRKHKEKKKEKHCKKHRKEVSSSSSAPEEEIIEIISDDSREAPSPPRIATTTSPPLSPPTPVPPPPPIIQTTVSNSASSKESLSIEETNALRAKLGLKPLRQTPPPQLQPASNGQAADPDVIIVESSEGQFVHKPAENLTNKKETEKLREKLTERKEKREIEKKLKKIKSLGADDSGDDESASAWILKSRKIEEEKKLAARRAQELDEMDEAFGISDLIKDEIQKEKKNVYKSNDLKGLTVEHDIETFTEGKSVILTLKDKDVLDENNSDTLVNVNILDDERYKKNLYNRRQKPYGYDEFDEEEQLMDIGERAVLKKYDEEIDGEKKSSFVIGEKRSEISKEKVKAKLRANMNLDNLQTNLTVASDYFTSDEMSLKFKKIKKVKKVRRKPLKADDLVPLAPSDSDMGTRRKPKNESEDLDVDDTEVNVDMLNDLGDIKAEAKQEETEFNLALDKARRLIQMKEKPVPSYMEVGEMILSDIKEEPMDMEEQVGEENTAIVLNSTAEFCRTLGDIPTYGMAGNREEIEQQLLDVEKEKWLNHLKKEQLENEGGWQDAQMDTKATTSVEVVEAEPILDVEPDLGSGVAGALHMALSKGYLEKETTSRPAATRASHLQVNNYSIEDKNIGEDDKYGGRRERYMGPTTDFKEKDTYKPNIKLEYIDDEGHLLSAKEAFRYLSHKFHGKGPGKNKIEKRLKKGEQEALMKQMNSSDTPLGTLQMLQQKQKETHSPYVVLSGNKQITPTAISKLKPSK